MGSCPCCGFPLRRDDGVAPLAGAGNGPRPSGPPSADQLRHLYLCQGLSTYQIAGITGIDRQRVTRLLRKAGVVVQPRGAGRGRPHRRATEPAELRSLLAELYVRRRLSTGQIGRLLGIPERRIRERLRQFGIRSRSRGTFNREDRVEVPLAPLEALYVHGGMSADQVGAWTGTSRGAVLRSAHDLGLAVRIGGAAFGGAVAREIELVEALYADPAVGGALARHRIPEVPPGGPIWHRFPQPFPLSKELLHDLYVECGLSLHHVELLTGQPTEAVRRLAAWSGIPLRPPGGRSPFLRRWWRSERSGGL